MKVVKFNKIDETNDYLGENFVREFRSRKSTTRLLLSCYFCNADKHIKLTRTNSFVFTMDYENLPECIFKIIKNEINKIS